MSNEELRKQEKHFAIILTVAMLASFWIGVFTQNYVWELFK